LNTKSKAMDAPAAIGVPSMASESFGMLAAKPNVSASRLIGLTTETAVSVMRVTQTSVQA
jgi:hypothetical protein